MFFDQENLQFQLLDVLLFQEKNVAYRTAARPHCALSLRLNGDTDLEFKNQTIHVRSHDLAFFPPDLSYIRRARYDDMIVFHLNLIQGELPEGVEVLHDYKFEILQPLFESALREWTEGGPGYQYRTSASLSRIFGELASANEKKTEKRSPVVTEALAYIGEQYTDPSLTVERVAAYLHISETYLRRIFQGEMGVSPKKYLMTLRMNRAKSLLNAGYDPVNVIAEKVGFRDAKNFATAFKKQFGYPPSMQRYA